MDISLHWTEQFARYGVAIVRGLVDREYCDGALERVRAIIGHDLPLHEWNKENTPELYQPFAEGYTEPEPVFAAVYDQPRLRAALDEMLGGPGRWNGERINYLFLKPYDPNAKAELSPTGHIDFGNQLVPILYRGFLFQVSLVDTEPFSGNMSYFPGTHKDVQKILIDNPEHIFKNAMPDVPMPEPLEFVAQAGDVVFWSHLVMHSGNVSHAAGRTPRCALTCECFNREWPLVVDPVNPNLSPWERSFAQNGYYEEKRGRAVELDNLKQREIYWSHIREKAAEKKAA